MPAIDDAFKLKEERVGKSKMHTMEKDIASESDDGCHRISFFCNQCDQMFGVDKQVPHYNTLSLNTDNLMPSETSYFFRYLCRLIFQDKIIPLCDWFHQEITRWALRQRWQMANKKSKRWQIITEIKVRHQNAFHSENVDQNYQTKLIISVLDITIIIADKTNHWSSVGRTYLRQKLERNWSMEGRQWRARPSSWPGAADHYQECSG